MNSKSDNPNGGTRHGYEKGIKFSLAALVVAGALVGCGKAEDTTSKDTAKGSDNTKQELSGTIAGWFYSSSTSCGGSWKEIHGEKFKSFYSSSRWR